MDIPTSMTDAELKQFIDNSEQFFHEPGEIYNELITAGYSKEKLDGFIAEKKKREQNSFRTISLFLAFVLVNLGLLSATGYFGKSWFALLVGLIFCSMALWLIRKAFD
jgi:hypothetical protein